MLTKRRIGMLLIAGILTASSAMAAPITFQINDDTGGLLTNNQTGTTFSFTQSGLTLTLSASGVSATNLREGGNAAQSGVGVTSTNDGAGQGGAINQANGMTALNEAVLFSFTDSLNNPIAVNVVGMDMALFRASDSDSATVSIGAYSQTFSGGVNNAVTSLDLGGSQLLAANSTGSVAASSAASSFVFRSITVEAVPEPGSLVLVGLGSVLMMGKRRRVA